MARFVPMAVGAVALLLLGQWLLSRPTHTGLTARVPGQDHEQIVPPALIDLKNGQLTAGTGKAAEVAGEWPGFRGGQFGRNQFRAGAAGAGMGAAGAQAAVDTGVGGRIRWGGGSKRAGLCARLRYAGAGRYVALLVVGRRERDLAAGLSRRSRAQPWDHANGAGRDGGLCRYAGTKMPRRLPGCGQRGVPMEHRFGAGTWSERAGMVRGAVPVD